MKGCDRLQVRSCIRRWERYQNGRGRKAIWKAEKGALRKALRNCQTDMCTCVAEHIRKLMEDPHDGLVNRLARGLAGNAVSSQIPGHVTAWDQGKTSLKKANDFYDQHCGGPPPHPQVEEFPTKEEWQALHGRPMPGYSEEFPPPLTRRIWDALPSAEQVCVGGFTDAGGALGGAGGFILGGGGGAIAGTAVTPGAGTIGGGVVGAWEGAAVLGAGGATVGYGIGDWLCR